MHTTLALFSLVLLTACTQTDPASAPDTSSEGDTGDPDSGTEEALDLFSFFVTSRAALQELSGSEYGFGGDLSYGHTGLGAGLAGADQICGEVAEMSMPGASAKQWRAFLSAAEGEDGEQVDAIDRIGEGPWYDRVGREVAPTKADLLHTRPENGDSDIANDLPNENGVPNSEVDPGTDEASERNHHILTGSGTEGTLFPSRCWEANTWGTCIDNCVASGGLSIMNYECENCELPIEDADLLDEFCAAACNGLDGWPADCDDPVSSTCLDWTTSEPDNTLGQPRIGLSWPRDDRTVDQEWISWWTVGGCAPVGTTGEEGGPEVGQPGSYGGFYCFALEP